MPRKVFAIIVKASRVCVVDAESEAEAQKIAMEDVEFEHTHMDEAETRRGGVDLTTEDIERELRHGAQDLREDL